MKRFINCSFICAAALSFTHLVADEVLDFDELSISANKNDKESNKAYKAVGAVSIKDDIQPNSLSIDSVIRSVPGAYTQIDQAQGGVSVNIRGMNGYGRVDTMIDGVSQTFYGSATDSSFHGSIGTSNFQATIDPNFLVGVDIIRGSFSGASNALMGSANFKTINIDDIIRDGRSFGFLNKYSYGSNAVGPSFMSAVALRHNFMDNKSLGLLFAYSGQNISQNYKIGGGGYIGEQRPPFDSDDDGIDDDFLEPSIDPSKLKNKPRSKMAKLEYTSEYTNLNLAFRNYKNNIAGRLINNKAYQINYGFNPTEQLDLKLLFAYNDGKQVYNNEETWGYHDMSGVITKNRAIILDLNNTNYFDFDKYGSLDITYGANMINNRYDNDFPVERVLLPYILTAFYPKGEQEIKNIYVNNNYEKDIFSFSANLNYVNSSLSGHKAECSELNPRCFPKEAANIEKTYNYFNYSLAFNANLNSYFNPFITYSRSHRIPNVQEFFFTHDVDFEQNINTGLKAERADTFQIGFNAYKHDNIFADDIFGFKILYFNTKVKDYIYDRRYQYDDYSVSFLLQQNDKEPSYFRGVEMELRYDMGLFYTNLSYTYQKSKHKYSDSESLETGGAQSGQKQFAQLPKHYANLNLGTRLFDEKLDIGLNARYTSKATRIVPIGSLDDDPNDPNAYAPLKTADELPKIPTILDLYVNYEIFKNCKLRFDIQNVFDKNYMDALYAYNTGENQNIGGWLNPVFVYNNQARGRTFIFSFEYLF